MESCNRMENKITESDIWDDLVFDKLKKGDIILNKGSGNGYTVDKVTSTDAIAIKSILVTNPDEWQVLKSK